VQGKGKLIWIIAIGVLLLTIAAVSGVGYFFWWQPDDDASSERSAAGMMPASQSAPRLY
jgi:flagellar basal body-associated protein FliL